MMGDKIKFIIFKAKIGAVMTFGNNNKEHIVGVGVVLPSRERLQKKSGCWLQEARIGLDPKAKTGVVLGWRRCIALHGLEV